MRQLYLSSRDFFLEEGADEFYDPCGVPCFAKGKTFTQAKECVSGEF